MNVYDFDNTIYRGESGVDLFKFFLKRDPSLLKSLPWGIKLITDYKLAKLPLADIIEKHSGRIEAYGQKIGDLQELTTEFWNQNSWKIKPFYIEHHQEDDVIISACLDFVLDEICKRLNVKYYVGSEVDMETRRLISFCYRENKVKAFYKHFPGKEIDNLYTDSYNDKPLMEIAKNVYLVRGNKMTKIKEDGVMLCEK